MIVYMCPLTASWKHVLITKGTPGFDVLFLVQVHLGAVDPSPIVVLNISSSIRQVEYSVGALHHLVGLGVETCACVKSQDTIFEHPAHFLNKKKVLST